MITAFVVIGHAGIEDDYRTWNTKAFYKLDDAEAYRNECQEEADRIVREMAEFEDRHSGASRFEPPQDPLRYWDEMSKITDNNAVDEYFEYQNPIDYTIEDLEIE